MDLFSVFMLFVSVAGIYSAYLTQGIVSEHLSTSIYGAEQERFVYLEALFGAQSFCCFIWALVILYGLEALGKLSAKEMAPWHSYWKAGFTNSIGPACGIIALKNISYSAQVLAKSCKMVPVMLMGTILHSKRYSMVEYVYMLFIGIGIALFAKKSSAKTISKLASPNAPLGYGLCFLNLVFDGYTNAAQDEINRKYPKNSPIHMMCWMNFWTAAYYAVYMFALTNSGVGLIQFSLRHPKAGWDALLFCLCGAWGQLFIFLNIKYLGSLANTLVCTTRKFFNILLSVLLNGNPLLTNQWIAVMMVFTGLIGSTFSKTKKHKQA